MSEREAALTVITNAIDEAAAPDCMTQAEAADFYEEIAYHCSTAATALREELRG